MSSYGVIDLRPQATPGQPSLTARQVTPGIAGSAPAYFQQVHKAVASVSLPRANAMTIPAPVSVTTQRPSVTLSQRSMLVPTMQPRLVPQRIVMKANSFSAGAVAQGSIVAPLGTGPYPLSQPQPPQACAAASATSSSPCGESHHRHVGLEFPWGGGCPWQCDKGAFKDWVRAASEDPASSQRRELYGFLCECFLDADCDKDGYVDREEFDFLVERAAALPRRFGLAPSWHQLYGDMENRRKARADMFATMDEDRSGKIEMQEWIRFAMDHIAEKVRCMDPHTVDFNHLEKESHEVFLRSLAKAVNDKNTEEYRSLYECLFRNFVEADVGEKGKITFDQFDSLVEVHSNKPRSLGLAPKTEDLYRHVDEKLAARRELFNSMDVNRNGSISFTEYLEFALRHIAEKTMEAHEKFGIQPEICPVTGTRAADGSTCPVSGGNRGF